MSLNINNILWDFDGVILDSMQVRDFGFRQIFNKFDKNKVLLEIFLHINQVDEAIKCAQ